MEDGKRKAKARKKINSHVKTHWMCESKRCKIIAFRPARQNVTIQTMERCIFELGQRRTGPGGLQFMENDKRKAKAAKKTIPMSKLTRHKNMKIGNSLNYYVLSSRLPNMDRLCNTT